MRLVIDRFECKYAVCELENGKFVDVLKTDIPQEAKEGDILIKMDIVWIKWQQKEKEKK